VTWPQVRGIPAAAREAASRERQRIHAQQEAKIAARKAMPTSSWWAEPLTWEQFTERHQTEAQRMNAVTSSYLSDLERVG